MVNQPRMPDFMAQNQIDLPRQQQVVEIACQSTHRSRVKRRRLEAKIDIGTVAEISLGARPKEDDALDSRLLGQHGDNALEIRSRETIGQPP